MKSSYLKAVSKVTNLMEADVARIALLCQSDKNRIIKFANLGLSGTEPAEIFRVIETDNELRTGAISISLTSPDIEVYNVHETMITLKVGELIEAAEDQKAIVSAEIQFKGTLAFTAGKYLVLVNHFSERSLTRILKVAYHKGLKHDEDGIPQESTVIVCGEGAPWE